MVLNTVRQLAAVTALTVVAAGLSLGVAPSASAAPTDFVSVWNTSNTSAGSSANNQISLPLYSGGNYNFTVNYGDGTPDVAVTSFNDTDATHTYATPGTYTVTISGTITGFNFSNSGDRLKLIDVTQWGSLNIGNGRGNSSTEGGSTNRILNSAFWGAANFNPTAVDAPDMTGVTNMNSMFKDALAFNGAIGNWDVSGVTSMAYTFWSGGNEAFNQPINTWDVSNVTDMEGLFAQADHFNQDISSWDVSNVTTMWNMFYSAIAFNQSLNSWDTASLTNMNQMFTHAVAYNQPMDNWDVSGVTQMNGTFNNNDSFNQDLSSWNPVSLQSVRGLFANNNNFNSPMFTLPCSVENTSLMFQGATSFNQSVAGWCVTGVTNAAQGMTSMFQGATSFNQPLTGWDTTNVVNMTSMFQGATSFNQDLSGIDINGATTTNMLLGVTLSPANLAATGAATSNGWSASALPLSQAAVMTAPAAPVVTVTAAGPTSVSVSWTTPASGGSPITGYLVDLGGGNIVSAGSSPYVVTGLTPSTGYTFQVAAVNAIGTGAYASGTGSTSAPGVPDAPVLTIASDASSATLSWAAPFDNGSAVTSYLLSDSLGGSLALPSGQTSVVVPIPSGSVSVTFSLVAVNAVGAGAVSNSVVWSESPQVSQVPASVNYSVVSRNGLCPAGWTKGGWEAWAQAPVCNFVSSYSGGRWTGGDYAALSAVARAWNSAA